MKNPIQPTTMLTIPDPIKGGEVTFELLFDFEAIAQAEDATGRPLLNGLTRREVDRPTISFVRAMLFAALLPTQPKITVAEASAFVTRKTMTPIWGKVLEAWVACMQDPEESESPDPSQSQD
jgi:hypothetical protein